MAIRLKQEIVGTKLVLRPFEASLITDEYIGWLNDKELMRYSQQSKKTHTRESCHSFAERFKDSPHYFWSIHRSADGLQIGTMTAYVNEDDSVADIGILVGAKSIRGAGYGKEAWGLAMQFLFERVGMHKITGGTLSANQAMIKIFEAHKMSREGALRQQQWLNGKHYDVLLYGILKEEWLHNR